MSKREDGFRRPFEEKIEKQVPHGTEGKDADDDAGDSDEKEEDDGRSHA